MCNINYLFSIWAVLTCLKFSHSNKLDTFWAPTVDCTHTSDPCTLFQDICEPHGTCVPQGCNYKCVCQGGFEGSDCLHPPSQTVVSDPSPEPSSNGNGKRLDIIVGNGALNFLDSLLKESTTASKVLDNIETTTAVEVTTLATSTKVPVQSQIQDSLPQSQPLLAPEPKTSKTDQSGTGDVNDDRTTINPADVVETKTDKPSTVSTSEAKIPTNSDTQNAGKTTASPILASDLTSATSSNQQEPQASSSTTKTFTNAESTEPPKEMTTQATPPTTVVPNDQLQSQPTDEIPNKEAFTTAQTIVKETVKLPSPPTVMSVVEPKQGAKASTTKPNQPQTSTIADVKASQTSKTADVTETAPTTKATKVDTPVQPPPTIPGAPLTQESTLSLLSSLVSELKTLTEKLPRTLGLTQAAPSVQSETTTTQPTTPSIQSETLPSDPVIKQESVLQQDLTTTPVTTTSQKTEQVTESKQTTAKSATQDTPATAEDLTKTKPTSAAPSVAGQLETEEVVVTTPKSNKRLITSTASEIRSPIITSSESPTILAEISKVLNTIKKLSKPKATTVAPISSQLSLTNLPILSAFLSPNFQQGLVPTDTSTIVPVPSQPASTTTSDTTASEITTPTPEITSQRTTTQTEPVLTTSKPETTPSSNSTDGDVLISAAAVKESKSTQYDNKVDKSSKDAETQIEDPKQNVRTGSSHFAISTSTTAPQSAQFQSFDSQPSSTIKKSNKHDDPISKSSGIQPWKTGELTEPKATDDNNVVPNTVRGHMTRKRKIFKDLIWDTIFALPSAPEFPESTPQSDVTPVPIVLTPFSSLRHVPTTSSSQLKPTKQNVATSLVTEQPILIRTTMSSVQEQPIEHQITTSSVSDQQIQHESTTSSVPGQPIEHHSTTSSVSEKPIEHHSTTSSVQEQQASDDDKKNSNEDQDDSSQSSTPDSKTIDLDDLTTVRFEDETSPMTSSNS